MTWKYDKVLYPYSLSPKVSKQISEAKQYASAVLDKVMDEVKDVMTHSFNKQGKKVSDIAVLTVVPKDDTSDEIACYAAIKHHPYVTTLVFSPTGEEIVDVTLDKFTGQTLTEHYTPKELECALYIPADVDRLAKVLIEKTGISTK